MTLGKKIYEIRTEKGYSQEEFANQLNVSRQAVSKWERDEALPDLYNLKNIAKIFSISIDELLDQKIDEDVQIDKVEIKNQLNYINFGLYALIIGAIIHLSSSFFGAIDWIIYLGYLNTGTLEGSSFLFGVIRLAYGVSFFGYIFYYLGYLMLLILFEKKLKTNIVVLLGISFFLIAFREITFRAGITVAMIEALQILIDVITLLIITYFMKMIKISKIDDELSGISKLIFYAFSLEILLIVLGNFNNYFIFDEITKSVFSIFINFGYVVGNLLFLIFGIWLINDKKNRNTFSFSRKEEPLLRKIRRIGLIIIATVFTPLLIISFGLDGTITSPFEIIGMLLLGFIVFLVYGIIMVIIEKITS